MKIDKVFLQPEQAAPLVLKEKRSSRGFSTLEIVVVLGVIVILSTAAIIHIIPPLRKAKADAALEMVLGEMRLAHERAINERRIYRFTFVARKQFSSKSGRRQICKQEFQVAPQHSRRRSLRWFCHKPFNS